MPILQILLPVLIARNVGNNSDTLAAQQHTEIDFQSIYNEKYIKDLLLDIASAKRSLIICGGYYSTGYVNRIFKINEALYANNVSMKVIIKKSGISYHEKLVQLF